MSQQRALDRIRKCLALAESSEPAEAAAALRQAKALMEKFDISECEASLSDICEKSCRSTGKTSIPSWEAILAKSVAEALGCRAIHQAGAWAGSTFIRPILGHQRSYYRSSRTNGSIVFIGAGPRPEIAIYAFESLRRQLKKARAAFGKSTRSPKRLDAYAIGWCSAVARKAEALVAPLEEMKRVDEAIAMRHGELDTTKQRDKCDLKKNSLARMDAVRGMIHGDEVQLNSAVGVDQPNQLGISMSKCANE